MLDRGSTTTPTTRRPVRATPTPTSTQRRCADDEPVPRSPTTAPTVVDDPDARRRPDVADGRATRSTTTTSPRPTSTTCSPASRADDRDGRDEPTTDATPSTDADADDGRRGRTPCDDETPFQRRDAALVPLIVASARKLKRVLADEQNEVLDALRRKEPVARRSTRSCRRRRARRPLRRRHRGRADRRRRGRRGVGRRRAPTLDVGPAGAARRRSATQLAAELVGAAARPARAQRRRRRRRQRRDHQARPRRLPRVEDAAHRRAARRPVPPRLLPGRVRRARRRARRSTWVRRSRPGRRRPDCEDNALAGAVAHRRRRSRRATTCAADAPRVPLPARPRSTGSVRARAARLRPPSAARADGGSPAGRIAHRARRRCSCSSSCSGGPSPASTSTTCGTTGSAGPTCSGASSGPR